jgi:hypothetical protein
MLRIASRASGTLIWLLELLFAILNDSFHVVSTLRRFGRSACNYFDRCALIYAGNWSLSFNSSYGKI